MFLQRGNKSEAFERTVERALPLGDKRTIGKTL